MTEVVDGLYKILRRAGLSEVEGRLYVASLKLGPVPVVKLAETLNITRPNIYKIIARLEKRGLARFSNRKGYTKTFMVESPSKVVEILNTKEETLISAGRKLSLMMPNLLAQYQQGGVPTKVKIFSGKKDFYKTIEIILSEASDEILYFGSVEDMVDTTGSNIQREFIRKRIKKKIGTRALLLDSPLTWELRLRDDKELRETRILDTKPFSPSFYLFANKALVWQPEAMLAILLEDEYIVEMFKSIFNKLWEVSE